MMVERSSLARRAHRDELALPYSRPGTRPPKKTSWLSGLFDWLKSTPKNELDEDEVEDDENTETSLPQHNPAAQALADRGHEMSAAQEAATDNGPLNAPRAFGPPAGVLPPPPRRPQPTAGPSTSPPTNRSPSSPTSDRPTNNNEVVAAYLNNKKGPLHHVEIAGIVTLLQDDRPPFKFSTSPAQSRDTTPTSGGVAAGTSAATNGDKPKPKMLSKNPNGTYRWQGGGSARAHTRNRYSSPGFGTSRSQTNKLNLTPEKPSAEPGKRRRVGDAPEASTSQRVANAPSPATPTPARTAAQTNGATLAPPTSRPNGVAKSPSPTRQPAAASGSHLAPPPSTPNPRLRTAGLQPSAPAVPSPLRQAWSGSSDGSPPSPAVRPTRAAGVMVELIKDSTPAKEPEFTNPYQAQYPGKLKANPKKHVPKRKSRGEVRAEAEANKAKAEAEKKGKGKEKERESEKVAEKKESAESSPRKAVEFTVPTEMRRARPPPELVTQNQKNDAPIPAPDLAPRSSAGPVSPEAPKAPTTSTFNIFGAAAKESPKRSHPTVTIEEVSDEDEPSPSKRPKTRPTPPAPSPLLPSAFPRPEVPAPAPSVTVEEVLAPTAPDATPVVRPAQVVEPSEATPAPAPTPAPPAPSVYAPKTARAKSSAPKAPSKLRYSIQPEREESESEPGADSDVPKSIAEVQEWVKGLARGVLPVFAFDMPETPGAGPSKAREEARGVARAELPTFSWSFDVAPAGASAGAPAVFDWAAAGMKKPAATAGLWKCGTCSCDSPDTSDKCTVCDAPRPGAASKTAPATAPKAVSAAPPTKGGFDWAAAGMKKPEEKAGQWKCGTCSIDSPDVSDKCIACETPRPGAASKAAPPATNGFNWAAAGMKMPEQKAGQWKCGTCNCDSPDGADKCSVCDTPRPGAAPKAAPPATGFDWAAAGMKPPQESGEWTCELCNCKSPAEARKCTICDEPRK